MAEAQRHHDDWHALRQEIGEHRRRTKAAGAERDRLARVVEQVRALADYWLTLADGDRHYARQVLAIVDSQAPTEGSE